MMMKMTLFSERRKRGKMPKRVKQLQLKTKTGAGSVVAIKKVVRANSKKTRRLPRKPPSKLKMKRKRKRKNLRLLNKSLSCRTRFKWSTAASVDSHPSTANGHHGATTWKRVSSGWPRITRTSSTRSTHLLGKRAKRGASPRRRRARRWALALMEREKSE